MEKISTISFSYSTGLNTCRCFWVTIELYVCIVTKSHYFIFHVLKCLQILVRNIFFIPGCGLNVFLRHNSVAIMCLNHKHEWKIFFMQYSIYKKSGGDQYWTHDISRIEVAMYAVF